MTSSLIEMFPFGISIGPITTRPVLVLKDKSQDITLPIWLGQLEAAIALAALNLGRDGHSPHRVFNLLLEKMDLKIDRCVVLEVVGHHQYVELHFILPGGDSDFTLKLRADDAMSVCLAHRARFFATEEVIKQSKEVNAEMANLDLSLTERPEIRAKTHPFLM